MTAVLQFPRLAAEVPFLILTAVAFAAFRGGMRLLDGAARPLAARKMRFFLRGWGHSSPAGRNPCGRVDIRTPLFPSTAHGVVFQ